MEHDANHFDTITICNNIKIHSYLDKETGNNNTYDSEAFLCGKMFSHSTLAKYSFKACDFHLFIPKYKALFHSEMISDNCFTDALKWTQNFFKRIRACLNAPCEKKNSYFTIAYSDEDNPIAMAKKDKNDEGMEEDVKDIETQKTIYFELHFIIDKDDIAAFRMKLDMIIEESPSVFIMNKIIALDKEEEQELKSAQERYYNKEIEIDGIEKNISDKREEYALKEKEYLYKFYLLNREKNMKMDKLLKDIEANDD